MTRLSDRPSIGGVKLGMQRNPGIAQPRRTEMERYLGIDVHRDSCTLVVLSAGGKKTDQRVVATEAQALVRYVKSLSGELHVCIDEGEWSEWLVELLSSWVELGPVPR